jgi:ABC-type bacteriocin/lantibiotic exporter with double-glycine peptidase domain
MTLALTAPQRDAASPQGALPQTILGFAWRTARLHQLWLAALTAGLFLLNLVPLELQRRIVNEALKGKQLRVLIWLAVAYFGVNLLQGAIKAAVNIYRGWVSESATRDLRRAVGRRIHEVPIESLEPTEKGVRVSVTISEVEPVGGFVGVALSEPLLQVGILVSVFGYMLFLQPWMAVITMALFAIQLVFVPRLQREINRRTAVRVNVLRALSARLVAEAESDRPLSGSLFETRISKVFVLNMGIVIRKHVMNFLMNLLYHLNVAGVFLIGGWLAIDGRMEYGAVVAFASGLSQLNEPWGDLVNYFRDLTNAQVKYRLIESFLSTNGAPQRTQK